jgi:hypothetical protein
MVPSLMRFLRKVWLLSSVKVSWGRVLKRLKESQAHFGDLFFIQVNPNPLKCLKKDHDLSGLSSRYSLHIYIYIYMCVCVCARSCNRIVSSCAIRLSALLWFFRLIICLFSFP